MLNYDDLVAADKATSGSIRRLVNHSDVDAELVLTEAEAWIYARLRAWEMRVTSRWTASAGDEAVELPEGFIAPIRFAIDGGNPLGLEYKHEDLVEVARMGADDEEPGEWPEGYPTMYYIMDGEIQFGLRLDDDYDGDLWYYGTPAALADANQTNFLTLRFPTLLTNVCRAFGFRHRQRIDDYLAELKLAQMEIDEANRVADAIRRGQSMT